LFLLPFLCIGQKKSSEIKFENNIYSYEGEYFPSYWELGDILAETPKSLDFYRRAVDAKNDATIWGVVSLGLMAGSTYFIFASGSNRSNSTIDNGSIIRFGIYFGCVSGLIALSLNRKFRMRRDASIEAFNNYGFNSMGLNENRPYYELSFTLNSISLRF